VAGPTSAVIPSETAHRAVATGLFNLLYLLNLRCVGDPRSGVKDFL
jgi:hypothetical protein